MRDSPNAAPRRSWPLLALALCIAAGCERGDDPVAASQTASGLAATTRSFDLHGAPGPWWRDGASDADFERGSRACLVQSREARRRAAEDARADAAYRAFLDCMEQGGWRRGLRTPTAGVIAPGR